MTETNRKALTERWPDELVERLNVAWCKAKPSIKPYTGVRAVLDTLASDPDAMKLLATASALREDPEDESARCTCEWMHPMDGEIRAAWPAELDPYCAVHGEPSGFPEPAALREEGEPIDEGWAALPTDSGPPLFWSDKAGHPEVNRGSVRRMTGQEPFRATLIRHPHTEEPSDER